MKKQIKQLLIALVLLSALNSTAFAQGTAFTYQGQLQNNGSPASGTYNLTFTLFTNSAGGTAIAGPVTNNAVGVTNGLFTVLIDFGSGVWNGETNWLEIGVETNGAGSFTTLAPRQQLTPTPYAIYAESVAASGINGTLTNGQLLHSAVTVDVGAGLSGGGKVGLGNTITLTNAGVLSVTGNADITAATVGGAVTLGDTATNTDTPSTLVKRDGSGNFSAASITLDGNLNLPATTATAGIIYSGGLTLIHAYGFNNFFAGPEAGNLTMSGTYNTANGVYALFNNTGGYYNTANGYAALADNTNGFDNTANGASALGYNTSGDDNTAVGSSALHYNTSGYDNTAVGSSALYSNTNGLDNTAIGYSALVFNTTGDDNTANGFGALQYNTSGSGNAAVGWQALNSNTSADANTAMGYDALFSSTTGTENTAIGSQALDSITNGSYNTAIGYNALELLNSGNFNIALGYQAGQSVIAGTNDIEIGNYGGSSDNNVIRIGSGQTAAYIAGVIYGNGGGLTGLNVSAAQLIGTVANSQLANSSITVNAGTGLSGGGTVSLGGSTTLTNAGVTSLTGGGGVTVSASSGAVTLGSTATSADTVNAIVSRDGSGNFSAGSITLAGTLTLPTAPVTIYSGGVALMDADSSDNFFVGLGAGTAINGSADTGVGYDALNQSTGFHNTGIGYQTLYFNDGGSYNVAAGSEALYNNGVGSNNVALGYQAGYNLTTGNNNIDIGNVGVVGEGNTIRIGTTNVQTKTFIAGISGVTISPSGGAVYVNANGQLGTVNSSRRFKEAIQDMAGQSDILLSLRPVSFHYKPDLDPQRTPQYGLIAEEVEKVAPQLVLRDAKGEVLSVRYEQINAMLLNEFLKQHRKVEQLEARLEKLEQLVNVKGGGAK